MREKTGQSAARKTTTTLPKKDNNNNKKKTNELLCGNKNNNNKKKGGGWDRDIDVVSSRTEILFLLKENERNRSCLDSPVTLMVLPRDSCCPSSLSPLSICPSKVLLPFSFLFSRQVVKAREKKPVVVVVVVPFSKIQPPTHQGNHHQDYPPLSVCAIAYRKKKEVNWGRIGLLRQEKKKRPLLLLSVGFPSQPERVPQREREREGRETCFFSFF